MAKISDADIVQGDFLKVQLTERLEPVLEFMRTHEITSFQFEITGIDISCFRRPLADRVKCLMERYGSIYVLDKKGS